MTALRAAAAGLAHPETLDVYGRFGRQHSGAYSVPLPSFAAQQRSWDAGGALGPLAMQGRFGDAGTGTGSC